MFNCLSSSTCPFYGAMPLLYVSYPQNTWVDECCKPRLLIILWLNDDPLTLNSSSSFILAFARYSFPKSMQLAWGSLIRPHFLTSWPGTFPNTVMTLWNTIAFTSLVSRQGMKPRMTAFVGETINIKIKSRPLQLLNNWALWQRSDTAWNVSIRQSRQ